MVGWSAVCDCGIFWTLSFKNCAQHRRLPDFIPHIIVNRLDFRLKKDGSYITFKSETALTDIFYAKKVGATIIIMCMLFHEHHKSSHI